MAAPWSKHSAVLKMDATEGATAVTDYSSSVLSLTGTPTHEVSEHYTVDSVWAKQTQGGQMLELDITVVAGSALHQRVLTAWGTPESATCSFEVYKPDSTTGSLKLSGEAVIQADGDVFAPEGGSADVEEASFKLRSHSTVTYATVA